MAKLQRTIEAEEHKKLSPELQELYEEKNGKFHLSVDDAEPLANALARVREERDELKKRQDQMAGIDPDEFKRLKKQAEEAERQRDLDEGKFEKILAEEQTKAQREIAVRDETISSLKQRLEQAEIDKEAIRAIDDLDGTPDLLLPMVKQNVKMVEIDGVLRAVVLDAKGKPRLKAEAESADDYLTIPEYVEELKGVPKYAGAFKGSGASGTRTNPVLSGLALDSKEPLAGAAGAEQRRAKAAAVVEQQIRSDQQ